MTADAVLDRSVRAREAAAASLRRAAVAQVQARHSCVRAERLVHDVRSRRLRTTTTAPDDGELSWWIEGAVDEHTTQAWWADDRLHCDPEVRARAEVVVDLGERVGSQAGGPGPVAALDSSTAALLTVIRALSRIDAVELPITS